MGIDFPVMRCKNGVHVNYPHMSLKHTDVVLILLINVKMPIIEQDKLRMKSFITSRL